MRKQAATATVGQTAEGSLGAQSTRASGRLSTVGDATCLVRGTPTTKAVLSRICGDGSGDSVEYWTPAYSQEMTMSVGIGFFWEVIRVLKTRSGTARYQKTTATGRKYKGVHEG